MRQEICSLVAPTGLSGGQTRFRGVEQRLLRSQVSCWTMGRVKSYLGRGIGIHAANFKTYHAFARLV